MDAIRVADLRKVYGPTAAVDGVSFSVGAGEVFALLGPNGAGKTTTVEILEGHQRRTSGVVEVLGCDPDTGGRSYRERIGIVLQDGGLEEDFTVRELVRLYWGMYPRRLDVDGLIDLVGLAESGMPGCGGCQVGNAAVWIWHWVWWEIRTCSSWTNRPPVSTHRLAGMRGS